MGVNMSAIIRATTEFFFLSSEERWPDISVDFVSVTGGAAFEAPARDHHLIRLRLIGTGALLQRRAGREFNPVIAPGSVILAPAGFPTFWACTNPHAYLRLKIPSEFVATTALQVGAGQSIELVSVFDTRDQFVERIGAIFLNELEQPAHPAQSLLVGSLAQALAAHLIRRYSTSLAEPLSTPAGLSPSALGRVASFIEHEIDEKITLTALADIAGVSRFHFTKQFKVSTGLTPMAYLERSRIRRAQEMIRLGGMSLAEIALAVGFSDQSHFTRRFRSFVGCTPSAFRNSQTPRQRREGYD
jgi:AraC family transcriptional regulator